ncbi:hypothetical protein F7R25_04255 [Burkholderia stagnalis]|uniref:Uncharacterized protein n=1 Tax=Burkholderia stagnalis TaxID=1503054 RepID=A0A6L3N3X6_9BURK|nr:hypothetical protein [Burkholderia stagnalis]KAB0640718.1 hypothetical protein F7R25_04255 [Burkholderia stagnalis]VWB07023.1 hypothetical protein BST28156_00154 [Burkholderia stagnalis]
MKTPTAKQKGIYMAHELYGLIISGKFLNIQKGRKGQSLKQSMDEVAEDFHQPLIPDIESFEDALELLNPIILEIFGSKKLSLAYSKSLYYTLLLMSREKQYGAWVALIAFTQYLCFDDIKKAQSFIPFLNHESDKDRAISFGLKLGMNDGYEDIAPLFSAKLNLLRLAGVNLNAEYKENGYNDDKTTIARDLAKNPADGEISGEMEGYLKILEAAHYHGVDLVKAIPVAEEEENQEFVSFAMKLKLEQNTEDKPVVTRVSKNGGKL